uniref:UspA domain-containing protein n=1 Tax=Tanacetum cinerariifolium TaxID=118510 RepID=A0A6L2NZD6_TANCI|nr:hypothetical protein [Tanacetum cinerariifolium]
MNTEKIAEQNQGTSNYFLFEDNELMLIEDYDDSHVYNEDTYGLTYIDPDCYYEEAAAIKEVQDIHYLIEQIRGDIEELEKKKKKNDVMVYEFGLWSISRNWDWSDLILLALSDDTFSSWADVGDDLRGDVEVPAFTQAIEAHQRKITDAIITHSLDICANKNTDEAELCSKTKVTCRSVQIRMLGFTTLIVRSIVDCRGDDVLSIELVETEVKTKIVIRDPKGKIYEAVEELNANLLVMGCRSFGPIKRMFLGSVTTAPTMCRALL